MSANPNKIVSRKVLAALADQSIAVAKKTASVKGEFGERLLHHKEHSNLHLKAAKALFALDAMDPDARALYLAHYDAYRDIFEKERWADQPTHYGDLAEMSEQEADEIEQQAAADKREEAAQAKANGERLAKGIKQKADEVGKGATVTPLKVGAKAGKAKGMGPRQQEAVN